MASTQLDEIRSLTDVPLNVPLAVPNNLRGFLSSPPFVNVDGAFNVRSLTSLPSYSTNIAPGLAFRSGTLEDLTAEGHADLNALGIKAIFDLRSLVERREFPAPILEGIEVIWTPSTSDNPTLPPAQKKDDRVFSFIEMYTDMMLSHAPAFRVVLNHVAAHPGEAFLFHCTAGKDRTGTLAYILEDLAGSTIDSMNIDYALTRLGVEPARDFLTKKLLAGKELSEEQVKEYMNSPKMKAYSQVPFDLMGQMKEAVAATWEGGVERYVKNELGLTDEEVVKVKKALRGERLKQLST